MRVYANVSSSVLRSNGFVAIRASFAFVKHPSVVLILKTTLPVEVKHTF